LFEASSLETDRFKSKPEAEIPAKARISSELGASDSASIDPAIEAFPIALIGVCLCFARLKTLALFAELFPLRRIVLRLWCERRFIRWAPVSDLHRP
jgi:hypothetical protein